MEHKIEFGNIPWESSVNGVRFKPYIVNGKLMRLVEFSREFVESDWCVKGHIGYILEGQMEIDFSGERIIFNRGDGLFIPEGEDHKHKATVLSEKVSALLIENIEQDASADTDKMRR